jgi:hypothetical protein
MEGFLFIDLYRVKTKKNSLIFVLYLFMEGWKIAILRCCGLIRITRNMKHHYSAYTLALYGGFTGQDRFYDFFQVR